MKSKNISKEASRSWFCVFNNPAKLFGEDMQPSEMVDKAIELWCMNKPQRTCAVNYEIGDNQTPHMHMVLEDPSKSRFSAVQKLFPVFTLNAHGAQRNRPKTISIKEDVLKKRRIRLLFRLSTMAQLKPNRAHVMTLP